jgi:hypothetical protein
MLVDYRSFKRFYEICHHVASGRSGRTVGIMEKPKKGPRVYHVEFHFGSMKSHLGEVEFHLLSETAHLDRPFQLQISQNMFLKPACVGMRTTTEHHG